MSDQEEFIDFQTLEFTQIQIQEIRQHNKNLYEQNSFDTPPKQSPPPNHLPQHTQSPEIKIYGHQIKPSDIDLTAYDAFDNYQEVDIDMDYPGFAKSIHLQSQEFKINYTHHSPNHNRQNSQTKEEQNHHLNIPIQSSLMAFKKPKIRGSSSAKQEKEHLTEEKRRKDSTSQKGNLKNLERSEGSLDFDIPVTNKLKAASEVKSGSSLSSGIRSSEGREINCIHSYQVLRQGRQIIFRSNNKKQYSKQITENYLQYIQKYFFYNFNTLLPSHIPHILSSQIGIKQYLTIYFDFILHKYPNRLYEFLQKSHYKQSLLKQSGESKTQSKLAQYTNYFVQKVYSGYDSVGEIVKKFKGQHQTRMRVLQTLFSKQTLMAEKQHKARMRLQTITNKTIHPSAYQKQQNEMKQKQEYVLMCLRWLVGFQISVETLRYKEEKADPVEKEKFQLILNQFLITKEKQQREKTVVLEEKIRSMFTIK